MDLPIKNRTEAGRALARSLESLRDQGDLVVLALPRGGVPVAAELARALDAPLDVMLVRKLGAPAQPELAMGAIASGGEPLLNQDVVGPLGISDAAIESVAADERRELERRERAYRGERPPPDLAGKRVILVDDGVATGATMRAAIAAVREQQPAEAIVAVAVAPRETVATLKAEADRVACLATPEPFGAISLHYEHFPQVSDDEVRALLRTGGERHGG